MNNTTRRSLFKKLGVGAAAVAALSVAGTSKTAKAGLAPIDPKRAVQVQAQGEANYQIIAALGGNGKTAGVFLDMFPHEQPEFGLLEDNSLLGLGVRVEGETVTIRGLDTLVNRGELQAARCTIEDVNIEIGVAKL